MYDHTFANKAWKKLAQDPEFVHAIPPCLYRNVQEFLKDVGCEWQDGLIRTRVWAKSLIAAKIRAQKLMRDLMLWNSLHKALKIKIGESLKEANFPTKNTLHHQFPQEKGLLEIQQETLIDQLISKIEQNYFDLFLTDSSRAAYSQLYRGLIPSPWVSLKGEIEDHLTQSALKGLNLSILEDVAPSPSDVMGRILKLAIQQLEQLLEEFDTNQNHAANELLFAEMGLTGETISGHSIGSLFASNPMPFLKIHLFKI